MPKCFRCNTANADEAAECVMCGRDMTEPWPAPSSASPGHPEYDAAQREINRQTSAALDRVAERVQPPAADAPGAEAPSDEVAATVVVEEPSAENASAPADEDR